MHGDFKHVAVFILTRCCEMCGSTTAFSSNNIGLRLESVNFSLRLRYCRCIFLPVGNFCVSMVRPVTCAIQIDVRQVAKCFVRNWRVILPGQMRTQVVNGKVYRRQTHRLWSAGQPSRITSVFHKRITFCMRCKVIKVLESATSTTAPVDRSPGLRLVFIRFLCPIFWGTRS